MKEATTRQRQIGGTHIGGLEIVRVIREFEPIEFGPEGTNYTLGQIIDEQIANRLREGQDLQDVCLHLDPTNHAAVKALHDLYIGRDDQ